MKGALLDLDGIIADTSFMHFAAWRTLFQKHFEQNLPDELEEKTKGVSREDSLRIILNSLHIEVTAENFNLLSAEKNQIYVKSLESLSEKNILPGISHLLRDFKKHNIRIALASSSKNGRQILEKLKLIDYFDAIVDPSTIPAGKPAPDIFIAATKALSLDPDECVGIEDSVAGITAINNAGCISIAVGGKELNHARQRFTQTSDLSYSKIRAVWEANHFR